MLTPFSEYLTTYCSLLQERNQLFKTITIEYPPIKGKLIRINSDISYDIEKISFTGFLSKEDLSSTKSFQLVDQVWMIMKEIFEKNTYTLSKSGFLFRERGEE